MEHNADKAVPVKIVGTIIGSVVKQSGAGLEFCAVLFHHGIINGKEYGKPFRKSGIPPKASLAVTAIHLR